MALPSSNVFVARFPEFANVPRLLIDSFIAEAGIEVEEGAWGTSYTVGVLYLAAHKIALLPTVTPGRRSDQNEMVADHATRYYHEYLRLARILFGGPRLGD